VVAQQDARPVRPLRPPLVPRAEGALRSLRVPGGQEAHLQLGPEGHAPEDHRHWPHAVPQDGVAAVQERLPLWDYGDPQGRSQLLSGTRRSGLSANRLKIYAIVQYSTLFLLGALRLPKRDAPEVMRTATERLDDRTPGRRAG